MFAFYISPVRQVFLANKTPTSAGVKRLFLHIKGCELKILFQPESYTALIMICGQSMGFPSYHPKICVVLLVFLNRKSAKVCFANEKFCM